MKKQSFTIPYPPTKAGRAAWARQYGLNAYYSGKPWPVRKRDAEYWHRLTRYEMHRQGATKMFDRPVIVSFYWQDRLDIDNHAVMGKMIVDAMKGVLIKDDNRANLKGVAHFWHDDDNILIVIEEV